MEMFTGIFYIVVAVWLFIVTFMMTTNNFQSLFFFRLMPFLLALAAVFLALSHYGFVIQIL